MNFLMPLHNTGGNYSGKRIKSVHDALKFL
jgi:hypothetical protein